MKFPDSVSTGPHDLPGVSDGGYVKVCRRLACQPGKSFGPVHGMPDTDHSIFAADLNQAAADGQLAKIENGSQFEFYVPPGRPERKAVFLTITKERWTLNEFRRFGAKPSTVTEFDNWPEAFEAMMAVVGSYPTALVAPPKPNQAIRLGLASVPPGRFIPTEALKAAKAAHTEAVTAAAASLKHSSTLAV